MPSSAGSRTSSTAASGVDTCHGCGVRSGSPRPRKPPGAGVRPSLRAWSRGTTRGRACRRGPSAPSVPSTCGCCGPVGRTPRRRRPGRRRPGGGGRRPGRLAGTRGGSRTRTAARDADADGCLAIGGGSTIGLGKAIALSSGLPVLSVPTSYAGSEMTTVWGLTEDGRKRTGRDRAVLPRSVVYDPELTLGLPVGMSVTSAFNAIAHAVEALYAPDASPIVFLMAEEGTRSLVAALPVVAAAPGDMRARTDALRGAWLRGAPLGATTMSLHHKLSHILGGTFDFPTPPPTPSCSRSSPPSTSSRHRPPTRPCAARWPRTTYRSTSREHPPNSAPRAPSPNWASPSATSTRSPPRHRLSPTPIHDRSPTKPCARSSQTPSTEPSHPDRAFTETCPNPRDVAQPGSDRSYRTGTTRCNRAPPARVSDRAQRDAGPWSTGSDE